VAAAEAAGEEPPVPEASDADAQEPLRPVEEVIAEAKASVQGGAPAVSTLGTDAKKRADDALDKASACGHLREKILECKRLTIEEGNTQATVRAKELLEAYLNLIMFSVYMKVRFQMGCGF
jgi:hypothetical protein